MKWLFDNLIMNYFYLFVMNYFCLKKLFWTQGLGIHELVKEVILEATQGLVLDTEGFVMDGMKEGLISLSWLILEFLWK